jgi:hypothetical protein
MRILPLFCQRLNQSSKSPAAISNNSSGKGSNIPPITFFNVKNIGNSLICPKKQQPDSYCGMKGSFLMSL